MHNFAVAQPDLNWANPELRKAVFDMMTWWLDKGIDGFRMDVIDAIAKPASALAPNGGKAETCFGNPALHEYLKEMNRTVLSRYDIMTVGEASSATVKTAPIYAGNDGAEVNMVFQFEHTWIDHDPKLGKWRYAGFDLLKLKEILSRWQTALHGKAWNSLYWDNHDQPRVVSRFGSDSTEELRVLSAKMLAACLHMMEGTPYIYQGEELGMTNAPFKTLDDCRDVEIFNAYRDLVKGKGVLTHDEMMDAVRKLGRDNARTPMQWDTSANAGFSTGTPWIAVNPNYKTLNAASQAQDPASVFSFYKQLIKLRKEFPVIVHGDYELLLPEDKRLFVYRRKFEGKTLLVICNFSAEKVEGIKTADLWGDAGGKLLIGNYDGEPAEPSLIRPYETRVYLRPLLTR
jgi:oligo-1,6-glucosidase